VSVHELDESAPGPFSDHVTSLLGVKPDPASVSVTVATHVEDDPASAGGPQSTDVLVDRLTAWTVAAPPLPVCRGSPAYVAVTSSAPIVFREYVTEQVARSPVPVSEHEVAESVPTPPALHVTEPLGALAEPGLMSVTVAVQVDPAPTGTGVWQLTDVAVCRALPTTCVEPAAAPCCCVPA